MWALQSKSRCPCSLDEMRTGWSARFGPQAELAGWSTVLEGAEAQTAPISIVGAGLEAIRVGKIVYVVLLTKGEESFQHF